MPTPPNNAFAVSAEWDSREIRSWLARLDFRQWGFAQALAVTRTAQTIKSAEIGTMRSAFDRPTPFTLNSLFLRAATRQRPEAIVWFKDFAPKGTPAGAYLKPEVYGGGRPFKRFEQHLQRAGYLAPGHYLVPASGAPLDQYGNVQRSVYNRILSQLGAQFDRAQNTTKRSAKKRPARAQYFFGNPGGKGQGIWQRFAFAHGSAVKPIFLVSSQPHYATRYRFFDVAESTVRRVFPSAFAHAVDEALRTSR